MTTPLAVVVLAHADPVQVRRLIAALAPLPVVLHVDGKSDDALPAEMASGAGDRVLLCRRRRTDLSSWSLVAAELDALAVALDSTDAHHIAVLSGSDYPLVSVGRLQAELTANPGTRMVNGPLPVPMWDTPRNPDGGFWRLRRRFVTHRDRVLYLRSIPLRWPGRRELPPGVRAHAGSQWKVYARRDAEIVLEVARTRPDLVDFWRTTLVPDETFVASVLASQLVRGAPGLTPSSTDSWFLRWPGAQAYHPLVLTAEHFPELEREQGEREARGSSPLLFARKFSSTASTELRELVEERLR